ANTIDQEEDGDVDMSPTESSCSDRHFFVGAERSDVSTDVDRLAAERESMEAGPDDANASVPKILPKDVALGGLRDSDKGHERTDGYSATRGEPSIACVAEEAMAAPAGRTESKSPDLQTAEKRESSPDTPTIEDEDDQDYNFVFDDEEPGDSGRKNVRFSDEALWRVHEVRASFEQHELAELFYTTAELDVMLEEAEMEEALDRSKASALQEKDCDGEEVLGDNNDSIPIGVESTRRGRVV
ncbi:unnamed protein product, partial [Ectocarpus sp. 8 AP-2014]